MNCQANKNISSEGKVAKVIREDPSRNTINRLLDSKVAIWEIILR